MAESKAALEALASMPPMKGMMDEEMEETEEPIEQEVASLFDRMAQMYPQKASEISRLKGEAQNLITSSSEK